MFFPNFKLVLRSKVSVLRSNIGHYGALGFHCSRQLPLEEHVLSLKTLGLFKLPIRELRTVLRLHFTNVAGSFLELSKLHSPHLAEIDGLPVLMLFLGLSKNDLLDRY